MRVDNLWGLSLGRVAQQQRSSRRLTENGRRINFRNSYTNRCCGWHCQKCRPSSTNPDSYGHLAITDSASSTGRTDSSSSFSVCIDQGGRDLFWLILLQSEVRKNRLYEKDVDDRVEIMKTQETRNPELATREGVGRDDAYLGIAW